MSMIIKNDWTDKEIVEATDLNTLVNGITSLNVYNEDWSALCDGSRTTFPTSDMAYEPGTLRVYLNGSRQRPWAGGGTAPSGYDYVEVVASSVGTRWTMSTPPSSTGILVVDFQKVNI